jgi:RNA polymerase sigma factor (sigma-70 family)
MDDKRRRFEAQVLPHLDAAYRFARWLCRPPEGADDIVQEAMLRAFRAFDGLRGSDAKAWLLAIVRNCHLTALEQQARRAQVPLLDASCIDSEQPEISGSNDPESASIRLDERRNLAVALAELPENFREVLVLREVEDMGYREIAVATNVPLGTVMSRLARARAALKRHWLERIQEGPNALP